MSEKNKVLIIVGPTASGKSDLGVELALKLGGEVVSADSRQVYKGLDIGTGKITREEMHGVPHHLLDVADPEERFTAAEYRTLALKAVEDIMSRGKLPIIVGGTGFYIDAVTGSTSLPEVPPNQSFREELVEKTHEELFSILEKKDPDRAQSIDPKNKVRLIRALEIAEALGKVPAAETAESPYALVWVGINPDKKILDEKIHARLLKRLPGMKKEAENLHQSGLSWERMEELGLEYRYLARLLQGTITEEQFITELFAEIKKYARRQMTWFKRNPSIHWITSPSESEIEANGLRLEELRSRPRQ